MKRVLQQIDGVLSRVPADSVYGRRVRDELVEHLEAGIGERVGAGATFERAVAEATDAFGSVAELEDEYYDDYIASRYALGGLVDREQWSPHRALVRCGVVAILVGIVLGWLVPSVATFAAAFGVMRVEVNASGAIATDDLRSTLLAIADRPLYGMTAAEIQGFGAWSLLAIAGFSAFAIGIALTLRRVHAELGRDAIVLSLATAAVGGAFAVVVEASGSYGDALLASMIDGSSAAFTSSASRLAVTRAVGFGTVVVAIVAVGLVWARARRLGLGNTVLLRQCVGAIVLACLGLALASHAPLGAILTELAESPNAVSPPRLVAVLDQDLLAFVAGVVVLLFAVLRFERVVEAAWRIRLARTVA